MKIPQLAIGILFMLFPGALFVLGDEPVVAPISDDAPASDMPRNPNHLEPIPAYDPDGYDQAVFRSLVGEAPGELWMIGKPSFSPEYAVILHHEIKYAKSADPFDRKVESEKWIVEYVEAKKQIWRWKEIEGGRSILDIRVTKDVTRNRVEVTREFSSALLDAWQSVLRKTRYPDADYRGLDGATFQFYCRHNLFGEIWTPNSGLPGMLTELGHELSEVAKADEKDRGKHREECLKLAKKLRAGTAKPEDAVGQPATRSESKSEGKDKPQSASEGLSR